MIDIDQYIADHIDAEPTALHELYRSTHLRHLYPRMCSGHVQGRLLAMLTTMIAPRRVLELGTYTGYATLSIAEGVAPGGTIDTVEIDDELEDELTRRFADANNANTRGVTIKLHIGDALEVIPRLDGAWDMIFIDADKRLYSKYYNLIIERLSPGGYIIVDNTLWDGKVADPEAHDAQTRGIADFNDLVASDPRVSKVIIPVRDGLTLIHRLI